MPASVLICCGEDLEQKLHRTVLWRDDIDRYVASGVNDARMLVLAAEPQMVVVDLEMPGADDLLESLSQGAEPRPVVVVLTPAGPTLHGDTQLENWAAVLPPPPRPGWDDSLLDLMQIPRRRQAARYAVAFDVQTWRHRDSSTAVAKALDLSLGGLLVSCGLRLAVGDDLDLRFLLPASDVPIIGGGRVVRYEEPRRYGMQFQDLAGDSVLRLEAYLSGSA